MANLVPENESRTLGWTSIRSQIILGFGLILGLTLLIVLINYLALRNVQADIQSTVNEAIRVRERGLEIQNQFLLARQAEQQFLAEWRPVGFENAKERYVAANQARLAEARAALDKLDTLIAESSSGRFDQLADEVGQLGPLLDEYDSAFLATVDQIERRSQAGGLENQLQTTLDDLETAAQALEDTEYLRLVLRMSASEQAFFNTREQQYDDQAKLLTTRFKELVDETSAAKFRAAGITPEDLLDLLAAHSNTFAQLVDLERGIGINTAIFRDVTSEIGELTSRISAEGAVGLAMARTDLDRALDRSTRLSVLVGIFALAAGVVVAYLLARRILGPLAELTMAAQQIGQGNLEYTAAVSSQDEFGTLARVFNQMTAQLRELIGSLEQLVTDRTRALSTSFQVSRRLSTILDQRQLVSEVVEQVRSTFDYYHAHIYLFDDEGENLLMVGGTGEAGQAMLAAKHKLAPGQGLVGKAAQTGRVVLVPDVTRDPSWLPNPLLPGTRAEVAVPIILGDQVLGVLDVQHDVRGGLDQADAELLQSIANQVAIALHNARLYERAQLTADREALVNAINQHIQKAVTIEATLQIAAQELGQALGAQRTNVQLAIREDPASDGDGSPER